GAELWTPMRVDPSAVPIERRVSPHDLHFIARLERGMSQRDAATEVKGIAAQLAHEYPQYRRGWSYTVIPLRSYLLADVDGRSQRAIAIVMAAVGFLLLICCVNVANLLLVHGLSRERAMAVRLALGPGRMRLVR